MRARRTAIALGTVLALLASAPASVGVASRGPAASDASTGRDAGPGGSEGDLQAAGWTMEQAVLAGLNARRAGAGLPALVAMTDLDSAAYWWVRDSAPTGSIGPMPTVAADIAPWVLRGELYVSGSGSLGVDAFVAAMVAAAPAIALDATANAVGVGYTTDVMDKAYVYVILARDPFVDLSPADRFADEIMWLASHGVIGGWPDGTVRPTASVTRGAMAAFLYRFVELRPEIPACNPAAGKPFTDVSPGDQFCGAITWLADEGISTGYADGSFRPTAPVTRGAMAAFLYRWFVFWKGTGAPMPTCDPAVARRFTDVRAGDPFCGAIEWLASTGIADGWPDGTFRPGVPIARQAMAAFLFRFNGIL